MILALQLILSRVICATSNDPCTIPLNVYWSKLKDVDSVARKLKHLMYRDQLLATEYLGDAPNFLCFQLHLEHCFEVKSNNDEVRSFLTSLRSQNKTPKTDSSTERTGTGNDTPVRPPIPRPCNHCKVTTSEHQGKNCPLKDKFKREDLAKMKLKKKMDLIKEHSKK